MAKHFPDQKKTDKVKNLFQVPKSMRDNAWIRAFFDNVADCKMLPHPSKKIMGPDGFPYLALTFASGEPSADGLELEGISIRLLLDHCSKKGCGIVLCENESPRESPLWVFSYGDLSCFLNYKTFWGDPKDLKELEGPPSSPEARSQPDSSSSETTETDYQFLSDAEIEGFFPKDVQRAIGKFLESLTLEGVCFSVVSDGELRPSRTIVFDLGHQDFQKEEDIEQLVYNLQWFLPRQRALTIKTDRIKIEQWRLLAG